MFDLFALPSNPEVYVSHGGGISKYIWMSYPGISIQYTISNKTQKIK